MAARATRAAGQGPEQEPGGTAAGPPSPRYSSSRPQRRLWIAVGVSLLFHLLALLAAGGSLQAWLSASGKSRAQASARHTWLSAQLAASAPKPVTPPSPPSAPAMPAPEPRPASGESPARPTTAAPAPAIDQAPAPQVEAVPTAPADPAPGAVPEAAGEDGLGLLPAPIPKAEETIYFKPSELDQRAVPIASIDPQPETAARGEVIIQLRLYISATGYVDKVEVLSVKPENFPTDFAVRAFSAGRFDPARIADVPVASTKTIELSFQPN